MTREYTPLHLDILLHFHSSPTEYTPDSNCARDYAQDLVRDGLLKNASPYEITDKGKAHIMQILRLPLPEKSFVGFDGMVIKTN